jgi:hypothetical protein
MSILQIAYDSVVNSTMRSFHMKPTHNEEVMFKYVWVSPLSLMNIFLLNFVLNSLHDKMPGKFNFGQFHSTVTTALCRTITELLSTSYFF